MKIPRLLFLILLPFSFAHGAEYTQVTSITQNDRCLTPLLIPGLDYDVSAPLTARQKSIQKLRAEVEERFNKHLLNDPDLSAKAVDSNGNPYMSTTYSHHNARGDIVLVKNLNEPWNSQKKAPRGATPQGDVRTAITSMGAWLSYLLGFDLEIKGDLVYITVPSAANLKINAEKINQVLAKKKQKWRMQYLPVNRGFTEAGQALQLATEVTGDFLVYFPVEEADPAYYPHEATYHRFMAYLPELMERAKAINFELAARLDVVKQKAEASVGDKKPLLDFVLETASERESSLDRGLANLTANFGYYRLKHNMVSYADIQKILEKDATSARIMFGRHFTALVGDDISTPYQVARYYTLRALNQPEYSSNLAAKLEIEKILRQYDAQNESRVRQGGFGKTPEKWFEYSLSNLDEYLAALTDAAEEVWLNDSGVTVED